MAKHLRIFGFVQGVGYRVAFQKRARGLMLSGWVRNRLDGSVEAAVRGDAAAVQTLIDWAWRGPPGARVSDVRVADVDDSQVTGGELERLPTV